MTTPKDQSSKEALADSHSHLHSMKDIAKEIFSGQHGISEHDLGSVLCSWAKEDFIAGYSACESQLTELREDNERLRESLIQIKNHVGSRDHKYIKKNEALKLLSDVFRISHNASALTRSEAPECGAKGEE